MLLCSTALSGLPSSVSLRLSPDCRSVAFQQELERLLKQKNPNLPFKERGIF
jgi:hypothetical protein